MSFGETEGSTRYGDLLEARVVEPLTTAIESFREKRAANGFPDIADDTLDQLEGYATSFSYDPSKGKFYTEITDHRHRPAQEFLPLEAAVILLKRLQELTEE